MTSDNNKGIYSCILKCFLVNITKIASSSFHMKFRPILATTVMYIPFLSIWIPEKAYGRSTLVINKWKSLSVVILEQRCKSDSLKSNIQKVYTYCSPLNVIFPLDISIETPSSSIVMWLMVGRPLTLDRLI